MALPSRAEICAAACTKLTGAEVGRLASVIGLDGFVDEIIAVVDKRYGPDRYERLATIDQFARRIANAAGQSANIELVTTRRKLGGNGPIMANALARLGLPVTYIGNLGHPELHPVFKPMAAHSQIISIAEPGHTDALEFQDGKLMLGKYTVVAEITWENIIRCAGREKIMEIMRSARLIGTVNWTMLPFMNDIWRHLRDEVLKPLPRTDRLLFVDLADPAKRTREDLRGALELLGQLQQHVHVVLGLNLQEAVQVATAIGWPAFNRPEEQIEALAVRLQRQLRLGTVVIHPRAAAAAADQHGSAWFAGPFVKEPKISTGAGDHFNAGFVTARLLGLNLAEALGLGTATSGYYVRHAQSPTLAELTEFIRDLPPPEA